MVKNYLKIAFRNIWRNKVFSFINIVGIAIGLSSCLVITLFIASELQYDLHHSKHQRIFRLASDLEVNDSKSTLATTPSPWAPLLKDEVSFIEESVRLLEDERSLVVKDDGESRYESNAFFADSTFFDVFDFKVTNGNAKKSLVEPNTVVLTATTAKKYFGDSDPVGKSLRITTGFGQQFSVTVTAVTLDPPEESHFHYSMLLSMSSLGDISGLWSYHMFHTYLLLKTPESRVTLEQLLPAFAEKHINNNPSADGPVKLFLQPLTNIHLHSNLIGEIEANSNVTYVYVLSAIALVILALACFNFMNLSTVLSLRRAREVGLRKTVGATRSELVRQFLGEATLSIFLGAFIGLIITIALLPAFNEISQKHLTILTVLEPHWVLAVIVFLCLLAIITSSYPSMVLSSFKPAEVLKGKFQKTVQGNTIRKTLVAFQFIISITLVVCTMTLYKQLDFIKNKEIGFDKSQVMILTIPKRTDFSKITELETTIGSQANVMSVAACSSVPSSQIPVNMVRPEGVTNDKSRSIEMLFSDYDFVKTMGMKIIAGKDFSVGSPTDIQAAFILNEQAVKQFGWGSPQEAIGKKFDWVLPNSVLKSGKVIGVVKDFNFKPLNFKLQPLVILIQPERFQYLLVRLQPGNVQNTIHTIESEFRKILGAQPFEFTFLDETILHLYEREQRLGKIFTYSSALAIVIALLGIFALSMYNAKERVKEFGIRKVLGARVIDILKLSTREFVIVVLIANLIALPIGSYIMNKWLETYAYRISIDWRIPAISASLIFLVAIVTISFEAVRAASSNPVHSLRSE
jgi:putative ABC transport system permease protein